MGRVHLLNQKQRSQATNRNFKGERKLRIRPYHLSGVTYSNGCSPYSLCRNGFMKFFGLGYYKMASIEKTVMDGGLIPTLHGLSNRHGNASMNNETKASLNMFLETLKDEAEPHASKVVRLTTGLVLKDDDDNIELPSSYTKRRLYCRWCWEREWDIRPKGGNGSYGKVKDYTRRVSIPGTSDDVLWPVDSVSLPVCTMALFSSFWKEHHPLLIIKKSSHDTCGVCYLFSNALNGLKRRDVQK